MENLVVTGLASEEGYARLTLRGLPPTTETVGRVAAELGGAGISLDMLVLADRADGRRQIQLTVTEDVLHEALPICERIAAALDGEPVEVQRGLSRVALVGSGMQGLPGVYGRAFETLVRGGIEVHAVSTSAISITVLVDTANEERTLQLLHTAFDLDAETE